MAERVPAGLKAPGKRLWVSVADEFELEEHERALLLQAARTTDLLEDLEELIRRDGPLVASPQGTKANPAAVEARAQRIALARLVAVLRLPSGEAGDHQRGARQPRRVGVRGAYGIRGSVS